LGNLTNNNSRLEAAGEILRRWRMLRKISQMDLALEIGVSPRHLSFVETGKSRPGRELVLRIAQFLNLPYRQRNAFLMAAGYAPEFRGESLESPEMEIVREAINQLLANHEPFPAFVVDAGYKILMKNSAYERFVRFYAGQKSLEKYDNAIRILFAEDGLRPYVQNWPSVEKIIVSRLAGELMTTQNNDLLSLYKDISSSSSGKAEIDLKIDTMLPVMSLSFLKDSTTASFFTTIVTFGTPLDLTTQEIRIELLFPSDEETKNLFSLNLL